MIGLGIAALAASVVFVAVAEAAPPQKAAAKKVAPLRFEISVPASAHAQPITGRVYVMIARPGGSAGGGSGPGAAAADREPRLQIGRTGTPFFGRDIEKLAPGAVAVIDATDLGTPVASWRDIPAGDYVVQAMVNVYAEFKRADGHVVWMHDDQWEGQRWTVSPGNLYSTPVTMRVDSAAGGIVKLVADQVIPPIAPPADTPFVKRFKIQSPMLTKFWGRPIYLGATVLLPRDYDRETMSYPVLYDQGHFSSGAPLRFDPAFTPSERQPYNIATDWLKPDFPKMVVVTFQHPTPYFDDSYAVNSVNVGPYGDAIMQELIPEVEKRFRVMKEPYARVLSGGSTGGWESLALQIFHPDFFGGTWSSCPDSVTFTDVEGINIYKDTNAFYKTNANGWLRVPTINSREVNGQVRQTSEQRNHFELVHGTKGRSGEQLDIWSAVYGPLGADGYFQPVFNKRTGEIDSKVAQYWRDNFDLLEYLKRNWAAVGPKLVDKIHVYTGTADTYFLNNSTRELQDWMKTTANPHYEGYFLYGDGKPHCWSGPVNQGERMKEMAQHILAHKPDWATAPWWPR
jgi:S-formylglutathione hydrolase FrmB